MVERPSSLPLFVAISAALGVAVAGPGCLERRDASTKTADAQRCASCHGDAERSGDFLERAAPPFDLAGQSRSSFVGVGAHAVHLERSGDHAAVACNECHVVPDRVGEPGHADDARPAEVVFGALARARQRSPSYDAGVGSCTDSYCHGTARPLWTEPRSEACGSCHGLPPPAPHPQSDACHTCHADVMDAPRHFSHPERHVDGTVDYAAPECRACHGSRDNAAPPRDLQGESLVSALGVGAHQVHLAGGLSGRPLACGECHVVPENVEAVGHVDPPPVEVTFSGAAQSAGRNPSWQRGAAVCADSFCHSPSPAESRRSPSWTEPRDLDCQSCHGTPPPAPHPQLANCSDCHGDVVASDNRTILDRALHVDGRVDLTLATGCTACHGSTDPAPPLDLAGNQSTDAPGVGAHRSHVMGSASARAVPCGECHLVPEEVLDAGHLDSELPAELVFSGAAVAFGATPSYANGSCAETACHGAVSSRGQDSGGSNTAPVWTIVDGTQAACGSCHGLPPPRPHPLPSYPCHQCHRNLAEDDVSFTRPDLHVDGKVTLQLP